jgi:hypothetical protein
VQEGGGEKWVVVVVTVDAMQIKSVDVESWRTKGSERKRRPEETNEQKSRKAQVQVQVRGSGETAP